VSDFFDPPPAPAQPEPPRYLTPAWIAPPSGTVALDLVLAQTDKVAVCIPRVAAYPTGFELEVLTMNAADQDVDPMMFHHRMDRRGGGGPPPEFLRLGIQFSDGAKATNTSGYHHDPQPPAGPIMHPRGGGGGGGSWNETQWVWPLPPPGTLTLVCEWPAMDIPLTRSELDAQLILDAADRAQVIFSDEHLPEPPDDGDGPSPVAFIS
jgi:hypothetical protein